MEEKDYLEKILNGEKLSESELKDLVFDYEIDCQEGDCGRWTQSVKTIVNLCGRHFAIDWDRGLTECVESGFYNQPYEVKKVEYEKVIKVTEWVKTTKEDAE